MKLTDKQDKFCREYIVDLNATQAAIRAGYKPDNAKQIATENLSKPYLQDIIAELQAEVRNRNAITVDFVINGIKDIALQGEQENNRLKAYDLLGKHLGVYAAEKIEHSGQVVQRIVNVNPTKSKK